MFVTCFRVVSLLFENCIEAKVVVIIKIKSHWTTKSFKLIEFDTTNVGSNTQIHTVVCNLFNCMSKSTERN